MSSNRLNFTYLTIDRFVLRMSICISGDSAISRRIVHKLAQRPRATCPGGVEGGLAWLRLLPAAIRLRACAIACRQYAHVCALSPVGNTRAWGCVGYGSVAGRKSRLKILGRRPRRKIRASDWRMTEREAPEGGMRRSERVEDGARRRECEDSQNGARIAHAQ